MNQNQLAAPSLSARIEAEIPQELILKAIKDGLTATSVDRTGCSHPDAKLRLDAAKLALSYVVGVPIQRSESVTVNLDADSAVGLRERLKNSPAMRDAIKSLVLEVEQAD